MSVSVSGHLAKMQVELDQQVQYFLPLDDHREPLNVLLGKQIRLEYLGDIHCIHCGRRSKKSFSQGYCYPCFTKLPQCDTCIMSPEKCHYEQGTCRDPSWGEEYCFTDHYVYLANSSGVKVGITRGSQIPTRWIDQGATQAMPIFRVKSRYQAGLIEDCLREHVADRTHWQKMLKGNSDPVDLEEIRDSIIAQSESGLSAIEQKFGLLAIQRLYHQQIVDINFPVLEFPEKVKSLNFDKQPIVEGVLQGIKGQYLILDTGVINIRKFTAYNVQFSA
ncbi:DUF2797 domain-containing protein [Porticoccaceae bacterium]|jgi:hypothetical protein|nr:DUF2797 domain-containing protein [Porticoccaceae bacterium]MDA8899151.1 DUF2797 domain-containing protein [Porticoccaceae bacterium]MDB3926218.1 DUF2797 domain-containing protein [Porticoccaceae bacterium]